MNNKDFEYSMRKVAWLRKVMRELKINKDEVQEAVKKEFGQRGVKEYKGTTVDAQLKSSPLEIYDPAKIFADHDPYELAESGLVYIPKGKFEKESGLGKDELASYLTCTENGSTTLYITTKPGIKKSDLSDVKSIVGNYPKI